jgi:hypothetical protein
MSSEKAFADGIILHAAALKYKKQIVVYNSPHLQPAIYGEEGAETNSITSKICLAHVSVNLGYGTATSWIHEKNDHYVSLKPRYSTMFPMFKNCIFIILPVLLCT